MMLDVLGNMVSIICQFSDIVSVEPNLLVASNASLSSVVMFEEMELGFDKVFKLGGLCIKLKPLLIR